MKDKTHEIPITDKTQLIEHLIRVWFHFEKIKALCALLINGMSRRVAALTQIKGGQTKYLAVCFLDLMNKCQQNVCLNAIEKE